MQLSRLTINSIFMVFLVTGLSACGGGDSDFTRGSVNSSNTSTPSNSGNWFRPAPLSTWQWQLGGPVNTSYNVSIYDIDLFNSSLELIQNLQGNGRKVICYFSAGSFEDYREDADLFDPAHIGQPLDGFADERWLDIRSTAVRDMMKARLDLAQQKGCDAVEPDNVDGYDNNTGFNLSYDDQIDYNIFLANEAHARGMSIGLKNDLYQVHELVDYFDFAINEQCFEFSVCNYLLPFVNQGKAVFNVEYDPRFITNNASADALCHDADSLHFSTLVLPYQLDDSFRFSCR